MKVWSHGITCYAGFNLLIPSVQVIKIVHFPFFVYWWDIFQSVGIISLHVGSSTRMKRGDKKCGGLSVNQWLVWKLKCGKDWVKLQLCMLVWQWEHHLLVTVHCGPVERAYLWITEWKASSLYNSIMLIKRNWKIVPQINNNKGKDRLKCIPFSIGFPPLAENLSWKRWPTVISVYLTMLLLLLANQTNCHSESSTCYWSSLTASVYPVSSPCPVNVEAYYIMCDTTLQLTSTFIAWSAVLSPKFFWQAFQKLGSCILISVFIRNWWRDY
jgi:hypothetical protein